MRSEGQRLVLLGPEICRFFSLQRGHPMKELEVPLCNVKFHGRELGPPLLVCSDLPSFFIVQDVVEMLGDQGQGMDEVGSRDEGRDVQEDLQANEEE